MPVTLLQTNNKKWFCRPIGNNLYLQSNNLFLITKKNEAVFTFSGFWSKFNLNSNYQAWGATVYFLGERPKYVTLIYQNTLLSHKISFVCQWIPDCFLHPKKNIDSQAILIDLCMASSIDKLKKPISAVCNVDSLFHPHLCNHKLLGHRSLQLSLKKPAVLQYCSRGHV